MVEEETKKKAFNLSSGHYSFLKKNKIPIGAIFILEHLPDIPDGGLDDLQWCQRKGYIDLQGVITKEGEQLYGNILTDSSLLVTVRKKVAVIKSDDFEKWWNIFPSTNEFEYNSREFKGVRNMKQKKEDCRRKFFELTAKYKTEEIIGATEVHILKIKEESYKKRENQLTYLPNSERYLRERMFEPYISKIGQKEIKTDLTVDL